MEGSTPHRDGLQFLSPHEAGFDRGKWGFFQQLRYLGKTDAEIEREEQESSRLGVIGSSAVSGSVIRGGSGRPQSGRLGGRSRPVVKPVRPAASGVSQVLTEAEKLAAGLPFSAYIKPGEVREEYFDDSEGDWGERFAAFGSAGGSGHST